MGRKQVAIGEPSGFRRGDIKTLEGEKKHTPSREKSKGRSPEFSNSEGGLRRSCEILPAGWGKND